jgi:type VI secretion system ImpM family protein
MRKTAFMWTSAGKHPSFGDFLRIGPGEGQLDTLVQWMEKGAEKLGKENLDKGVSWRMLLPALFPKLLVCGLLKDSRDSAGRSSPLIMLKTFSEKFSKNHWTSFFPAYEDVWSRMEALSMRSYNDIAELQELIKQITFSLGDVQPSSFSIGSMPEPGEPAIHQQDWSAWSIPENITERELQAYLRKIAELVEETPKFVFIGGFPHMPRIVFVFRPLIPSDFITLWSAQA